MFSPWKFNTDPAAQALLEASGWRGDVPPDVEHGGRRSRM